MTNLRLLLRSIVHYRRAHTGLIAGTLLASAILTGALVVGDSVDHTLRTFGEQRIGTATVAVTSGERLFSGALAEALSGQLESAVSALLLLPGMAIHQNPDTGERAQVNRVQALGVDAAFWQLGEGEGISLGRREAALDARLAKRLGVKPGDTVALRIAKPDLLSRDAPLSSREEDSSERANFTVKAIASDEQMGRFALTPSQVAPYNFFVTLEDLQTLAGVEGQANLMLGSGGTDAAAMQQAMEQVWRPEHAGLRIVPRAGNILQLESIRIFLDEPTANAALALPEAQGALTYLVNGLRYGEKLMPYSFVTASTLLTDGLRDDEMVINDWLATELGVAEGGTITMSYYVLLPTNGFKEITQNFTVRRILPIADFQVEKELVPEFPGLSNVESCKDWKIGMPMDEELLEDEANEAYWKEYRQTPKALITLSAGQALWSNRFGSLTGVRFPGTANPDDLMTTLAAAMKPGDVGLEVRSLREDAAAATAQAMDLGGLFLGMSFFLLGSALILTGLLYAFGMQQRASEVGLLGALGFSRARIRLLLLTESMLVSIPGAVLGAGFGMVYAWALMLGLAHLWQDAIGHIPVIFHASLSSVAGGIVATMICAMVTAALSLRRLLRHGASELIQGDFTQDTTVRGRSKVVLLLTSLSGAAAAAMVVYGYVSPPADVAGLFFGSGALALLSGLLAVHQMLARGSRVEKMPNLRSLALMNASRRRGRSIGMVASLAAGGFLVLAVSSMQGDVGAHSHERWSGAGGFALFGESTVPIIDPATLDAAAEGSRTLGFRVYDGDDASCLNLNHALRPRVLGANPEALSEMRAFLSEGGDDLWQLLNLDLGDDVIPALVGDSDTAMWTLKKTTGVETGDEILYRDEAGRAVKLKLVGKLPMRLSVFSGNVLVSAEQFTRLWPSQEGFRVFLMDTPEERTEESRKLLQDKFDRDGLDVVSTVERLEMFHAVEATYLSMFLVLGGIGLLLGASATGVVVLRNILERRREVALLRAVGFAPAAVMRLLATEYGLLLLFGAGVGGAASVVAMLPSLSAAHGGASPLWRLGVFAAVLLCAGLCTLAALLAGLRNTSTTDLRAE